MEMTLRYSEPFKICSTTTDKLCYTMNSEKNFEDVALIPPIQFFKLMDDVEALPMRKRTKWHGSIKDVCGVKRNVYYVAPGQLLMKLGSEWIQLKPVDKALERHVVFDRPETEVQHSRWIRAYERGGLDEADREHGRLVAENATGNHRSKPHKIRVHSRPGEPARA